MKLQSSFITLSDMRFHAYHGVMPQERLTGNDYTVSLRIKYDVQNAMKSDNVNDTLNYAEVYRLVCEEMMVPSNLLERVAYRIADRLQRRFMALDAVDVKITKLNPPMGADFNGASVELHFVTG